MSKPTIECPTCHGKGALRMLLTNRHNDRSDDIRTFPCFRCKGKGQVVDAMIQWIETGKAMKEKRISLGLSQWQAAKQLKTSPVALSAMEHGTMETNPALYDTLSPDQPYAE